MVSNKKGFTLAELLIAMFVLSLLGMFAFRAVNQLTYANQYLDKEVSVLNDAQKFFSMLERDIRQANSLIATTSGSNNIEQRADKLELLVPVEKLIPTSINGGVERKPKKITYQLEDNKVLRGSGDDSLREGEDGDVYTVLDGVAAIQFENSGSGQGLAGLSITVAMQDLGDLRRHFFWGQKAEIEMANQLLALNSLDVGSGGIVFGNGGQVLEQTAAEDAANQVANEESINNNF